MFWYFMCIVEVLGLCCAAYVVDGGTEPVWWVRGIGMLACVVGAIYGAIWIASLAAAGAA